eukprot:9481717-Pyramimonas_sp.AAC.1
MNAAGGVAQVFYAGERPEARVRERRRGGGQARCARVIYDPSPPSPSVPGRSRFSLARTPGRCKMAEPCLA